MHLAVSTDCVSLGLCLMGMLVVCVPKAVQAEPSSHSKPLRLGIVGLNHGHVYVFLDDCSKRTDVEIVGIADPSENLRKRYQTFHDYPDAILFADTERMLDRAKPEAVAVFTDTLAHRAAVEACAERGVDVMMEKPLAVSVEEAQAMAKAAEKGGIDVIVNYETTWYPNNPAVIKAVCEDKVLGKVHRIVAHHGNRGPKEINMPAEFTEWLTDPKRNGGGALFDFGCYGANLVTWLMENKRPSSVFAVTQQLKDDPTYANVDDEATILLTYPDAQAVLQPSWNWPIDRKDWEIYGEEGSITTVDRGAYKHHSRHAAEKLVGADLLKPPMADPISYLMAVARDEIEPKGPSSLENNLIVTEILDAARQSAKQGKAIELVAK